jgi:hypothetical protein
MQSCPDIRRSETAVRSELSLSAFLDQGTHKVLLAPNFQVNTSGGALGVVDSLGTGLDVTVILSN